MPRVPRNTMLPPPCFTVKIYEIFVDRSSLAPCFIGPSLPWANAYTRHCTFSYLYPCFPDEPSLTFRRIFDVCCCVRKILWKKQNNWDHIGTRYHFLVYSIIYTTQWSGHTCFSCFICISGMDWILSWSGLSCSVQ